MKKNTFHVHFWLKKTSIRTNGTMPIYARIRVDGIPADISTKESILDIGIKDINHKQELEKRD